MNYPSKLKLFDFIKLIETKYSNPNALLDDQKKYLEVGDIIKMGYLIPEGDKERIQSYEGLIISISNKGLGKTFTLRRIVQGIGVEQVFLTHSPKIISIVKKQSSKVRRAKLYFLRFLSGKSTRLKRKF
jgi:large subunit ribosomal protein L19